jgi:hypothetical protein
VRLGAVCLLPPPRRGGMVNPVGLDTVLLSWSLCDPRCRVGRDGAAGGAPPRVGRDGAAGGAPPRFGLFFLGGGPGMAAEVVDDCRVVGDR